MRLVAFLEEDKPKKTASYAEELTDLLWRYLVVVGVLPNGRKVGVCSGGAGAYAEEAKQLGCDLYITGEANWGETIAAENCGMKMICAGHYQTEIFGVKALAKAMKRALKVDTVFLPRE